jgi:hypothetical protein
MTDHLFICYARQDKIFALKLVDKLRERGISVWIDELAIQPGSNWNSSIDEALYDCTRLLVILSPAAVESEQVQSEWVTALEEKKPVIPVLYQKCRIPSRLRLLQHVDLRTQDIEDNTALNQLVRHILGSESDWRQKETSHQDKTIRERYALAPIEQKFEEKVRRKELNHPLSEENLAANLRWLIQCGTEEDLELLYRLKKDPGYPTKEIQQLIDKAIQKLGGQIDDEEASPAREMKEAAKAYQANKEEWDQQYAGQYVAVCQSKVMDSDADENELAERMIEKQLTEKKRFQGCILKIRGHRKKRLNPKEKASSSSRTSLA